MTKVRVSGVPYEVDLDVSHKNYYHWLGKDGEPPPFLLYGGYKPGEWFPVKDLDECIRDYWKPPQSDSKPSREPTSRVVPGKGEDGPLGPGKGLPGDSVAHPSHYKGHIGRIKGSLEHMKTAIWYLERELQLREFRDV